MAKNEAETRYELIDPVLRDKGYRIPYIRLETPAPVEPTGPKGRRRSEPGKTDYLLCVEVPNGPRPLPVAILEAKKEDEDSLKGMQQAKGYAECERFDAKYIFSANGHRYAKFNKFTVEQTGPFPFPDFPDHQQLTDCYHRHTGIKLDDPSASLRWRSSGCSVPRREGNSQRWRGTAIRGKSKTRRPAGSAGAQSAIGRKPAEERVFRPTLLHLADRIGTRLRAKSKSGRTVTVRVRFANLNSATRSVTLDAPISATLILAEIAGELVRAVLADHPDERTISLLLGSLTLSSAK